MQEAKPCHVLTTVKLKVNKSQGDEEESWQFSVFMSVAFLPQYISLNALRSRRMLVFCVS